MNQLEDAIKNLEAELPDAMAAFEKLHETVVREGAISTKYKRLMAVAVSVALRCDNCTRTHVVGAFGEGASRTEILEAAGIGIMMAGGPAMSFCATVLIETMNEPGIE